MPSFLALIKNAILARNEDVSATLKRYAELAEQRPKETDAQAVAAYYAWVAGENELALRFAKKADDGSVVHFHALLVLTAIHAEGTDHEATYRYAKRLSKIKRPNQALHAVLKPVVGLFALRNPGMSSAKHQVDELSNSYQEWVTWAQEFVFEYERARSDA